MNPAPDDLELGAAETAARDAVRTLAGPSEPASAAFRARLREGFLAGTLQSSLAESEPEDAVVAPLAPPETAARRVLIGPWPLRPAVWASLAAAAALAFVVGLANRGPAWEVTAASGEGVVRVDGQAVPAQAAEVIGRLAARGGRLQLPEGVTLDLVAPGHMAVRLAAGSDVRLSASPNRWLGRRSEILIEAGDVFVSTGPAFRGAQLAVSTAEARVEVLGTSFAVMRFEQGTCVCVMEGRVRVGSTFDHTAAEVSEGERRFCFPDQAAYSDRILDSSEHELHDVIERNGARLGR